MPRTSTVECPGCPPVRALTTDILGLVKVVEARGKDGSPKVVETWGPPDASRGIIVASYADCKTNPLLAIARKNGWVEFLNPLNGDALATTKLNESVCSNDSPQGDHVVGLHLFKTKRSELSSRLVFLTCTEKGKACLRSTAMRDAPLDLHIDSPSTWSVENGGKVECCVVDGKENYVLFGGKAIEMNLWDLGSCSKIWTAKSPRSNSLGIFTPTWFTAATFLSKDDHRKIVAGTNNHQVRLYDISAQRRPIISVDFRESPIKAVAEDLDGHTIYIGTGCGDLASFDMRTGKLLGSYVGKCCGSIRSIARHPDLPMIISCGLDSYLRFWDTKTRQLLSAVFLKQNLTNVVIDSHFSSEELESNISDQPCDSQAINHTENGGDEEMPHSERGKTSKKSKIEKKKCKNKAQDEQTSKKKRSKNKAYDDDQLSEVLSLTSSEPEDNDELLASKRRKPAEEQSRRIKQKKNKRSQ